MLTWGDKLKICLWLDSSRTRSTFNSSLEWGAARGWRSRAEVTPWIFKTNLVMRHSSRIQVDKVIIFLKRMTWFKTKINQQLQSWIKRMRTYKEWTLLRILLNRPMITCSTRSSKSQMPLLQCVRMIDLTLQVLSAVMVEEKKIMIILQSKLKAYLIFWKI